MNLSVCACVELNVDSVALDPILDALPRTDYEFTEWRFIDCDRQTLMSELVRPTHRYHPTTGYRLLLTFIKYFGAPALSEFARKA